MPGLDHDDTRARLLSDAVLLNATILLHHEVLVYVRLFDAFSTRAHSVSRVFLVAFLVQANGQI